MFDIYNIEESFNNTGKQPQEKNIYVFMGSYAMVNGVATLTYSTDSSFVYKKYRNIETNETYTINKASVEAFEKGNAVIYTVVDDYTNEEYERTYEVVKKTYEEELQKNGSKEKAYKIIKILTPLK